MYLFETLLIAATAERQVLFTLLPVLDTCYSAAYMSQTRDQQRFYNLGSGSWLAWANGAAAHDVLPSSAGANGQLDPRCS